MDINNKPLYIEDHRSGDLYQVLNILKDRTEQDSVFDSDISLNVGDEVDDQKDEYRYSVGYNYLRDSGKYYIL